MTYSTYFFCFALIHLTFGQLRNPGQSTLNTQGISNLLLNARTPNSIPSQHYRTLGAPQANTIARNPAGYGHGIIGNGQGIAGFGQSIAGNGQGIAGFRQSIAGNGQGIAGFGQSIAGNGQGIAGFGQSIAGYGQGIAGFGQSIAGNGQGIAGFGQSIAGNGQGIAGFGQSIAGNGQGIAGFEQSIAGNGQGIAGFGQSIAGNGQGIAGFGQSIAGNGQGNFANTNTISGITSTRSTSPYIANAPASLANVNLGKDNTAQIRANLANPGIANHVPSNIGNTNFKNAKVIKYELIISNDDSNIANNIGKTSGNGYFANSGRQYGLKVDADGLKMVGDVTVNGKLPIYGTVGLDGKLPTKGAGYVDFS